MKAWVAAGFNTQDAAEFVSGYSQHISRPNAIFSPRYPGVFKLGVAASNMAVQATRLPPKRVIDNAAHVMSDIVNTTYGGDVQQFVLEYYKSLSRRPPQPPPNPSPPHVFAYPPIYHVPIPQIEDSAPLSLVLPVGLVLGAFMLALVALFVARRKGWLNKPRAGPITSAPGVSPLTTLCITDIENSTSLWEDLPANAMEAAVKMHDKCVRGLIAKHSGYESWWEGDSFIMAFHHPVNALAFCMEAQVALLQLQWPSEVLHSSRGQEVWCLSVSDERQRETGKQSGVRKRMSFYGRLSGSPQQFSRNSLTSNEAEYESLKTSLEPQDMTLQHRIGAQPGQLKTVGDHYLHEWRRSVSTAEGAVLAYRGLRVRMGLNSGVDSEAVISFSSTAQRVRYSGAVHSTCNAVASAGHGGHTLISSHTASLLQDPDKTGLLTGLPRDCGVFYMGQHSLPGVDPPQELLLVLPDRLQCRLGVQQAPLRTAQALVPGILAAPVSMAPDPCALVFVRFMGLGELLAWKQEETLAAVASAAACLRQLLVAMGGSLSDDGLQLILNTRSARNGSASFPDNCTAGIVVAAFSATSYSLLRGFQHSSHPAVTFALTLRSKLSALDWHPDIGNDKLSKRASFASDRVRFASDKPDAMGGVSTAPKHLPGSANLSEVTLGATESKITISDMHAGGTSGQQLHEASYTAPPTPSSSVGQKVEQQFDSSQHFTQPLNALADAYDASVVSILRDHTIDLSRYGSTEYASNNLARGIVAAARTATETPSSWYSEGRSQKPPLPLSASTISKPYQRRSDNGCSVSQRASNALPSPVSIIPRRSSFGTQISESSSIPAAGASPMMQRRYEELTPAERMRGLQCSMVVLSASGARFDVATRSSGRVVYTGPPVKEALRVLARSKSGVVKTDAALLSFW